MPCVLPWPPDRLPLPSPQGLRAGAGAPKERGSEQWAHVIIPGSCDLAGEELEAAGAPGSEATALHTLPWTGKSTNPGTRHRNRAVQTPPPEKDSDKNGPCSYHLPEGNGRPAH